ncbi:MAG: HAMP domain-containing histidine kinase [Bacteroidales bacterium]|nr:HAMP domain-containing histidine kinase [Bacteroidales bacterium]
MKRKLFNVIIITTAIALSGIIVTQFFWVRDAVNMKNEQFYQNAHLGLKRVINQLMALQNDSLTAAKFLQADNGNNYHSQFIQSLDPALIKRMINSEFKNLELCKVYYYGIYDSESHEFVMLSEDADIHELLNSEHNAPISCVFQKNQYILAVYFPLQRDFVFNNMQIYISLSGVFMLIVVAGFWLTARSWLMQKKLSEMKTDFVNNMTHELKTPISTISIACEMLKRKEIQFIPDRVDKYANIIYNENDRLKNQVDHVLQIAMLDRKDYELKLQNVDLHELIEQSMNRFEVTVAERNGELKKRLNAAKSVVLADHRHISNVLDNLVDNAIKYSQDKPEITISTFSNKNGVVITVDDCGIGIADEHLKNIFKQFHRVPTGDLHDVKGFGLGLYYVKSIVLAHGGNITVKSTLGKGSNFSAFLPFTYNEKKQVVK